MTLTIGYLSKSAFITLAAADAFPSSLCPTSLTCVLFVFEKLNKHFSHTKLLLQKYTATQAQQV